MVQLWIPKDELKADLEDQARQRLEEIQREAEKRRKQIADAAQAKLNDERTQAAISRFNDLVDPLLNKGREALDGAGRAIGDTTARAQQLVQEAQDFVGQAPQLLPPPGATPQAQTPPLPIPEESPQSSTPPPAISETPQLPALPGQEGIDNLVGGIRGAMDGLGGLIKPPQAPAPPETPPAPAAPMMGASMFSAPGLGGLGGLSGLGPLAGTQRPPIAPLPISPTPGLPGGPDDGQDGAPGFSPPGMDGLGSALADRFRGVGQGVGDKVTEGRDQAMALAQKSLDVAQQALGNTPVGRRFQEGAALREQAMAGGQEGGFDWTPDSVDWLREQHRIGTEARNEDLASGKSNVVGGQVTDVARTLMGMARSQDWDAQKEDLDRRTEQMRQAWEAGDEAEMRRLVAEERAITDREGGPLAAMAKRLGRTLGTGYLGAAGVDPNRPGEDFRFREERPVYEADGSFTGRTELVESPTGAAKIWRDAPEQAGTLFGRNATSEFNRRTGFQVPLSRRNENALERAQAGFGLFTQPFNATGEILHGGVGAATENEAAAAGARLAGDVLGPGGAIPGYLKSAGVAADLVKGGLAGRAAGATWGGVREAAKNRGWVDMIHAGAVAAGLAAAPAAAKIAYESGLAGGMTSEEALAQAIDIGSASAQAGDLSETIMGAGRPLLRGARALRDLPSFAGRLGENLSPEFAPASGFARRMGAAARAKGDGVAVPEEPPRLYEPSLGGEQSTKFTSGMTYKVPEGSPDLDARLQEFFSKPRSDQEYRGIMNELMGNGTTAEKDLLKEYNKLGPPKQSDQSPMPQAFDPDWNPRLKVEVQPNGDVVKTLPSGTRRVEDSKGKVLLAEKRTAPDHETFLRGMLDDYAEIRDPKTGERPADFYPVFGGYMSREVSEGKSPEAGAGARHQMFGGWGATTAMTAPPHNLRKTLHINALVNEFIHKREELGLPARLPTGDEVQVMLRTGKMYFIPKDPNNPARTLDNELPLVEEVPKKGAANTRRTIQADLAPVWASGDLEGDIPNLPPGYRLEEVRANKRAGGRVTEDTEVKGYAVYAPDTVDENGQTVRTLATHVLAPGVDKNDPAAVQDKTNWIKIKHGSFVNKLPGGKKDKAVPKVSGWNVGSDWRVDEPSLGATPGQTFVVAEDPDWVVNAPATPKFMKGRGKAAVPKWVQGGKSAGGMWPTSQTKSIVKAIADNVFEVMGGPKGTTFSHTSERAPENLYNPLTVNDIQMADGFGFLRDKMANSAVAHRFMTEKMRALGEEMGLSPQEVQATWWAAIRAEVGNAKAGQPVIREPSTIAGQQFDVGDPVASGSWFEAAGQNQGTLNLYRRATQEPLKGKYKFFNTESGKWEDRNVDTTELTYLHKGTALPPEYTPTGPGSRGNRAGRLEVSRPAFSEAEKTARAEANRFFVNQADTTKLGEWGWTPETPQIAPLRDVNIQHDVSLAPDGKGFLVTLRDTGEGTVHRSASIIGRELNLPEVGYYHLDPQGTGLAYTFARRDQGYSPQEVAALSRATGLPLRMNPDGRAVYVVDDGKIPDLADRMDRLRQMEQPFGTTARAERITTGRVPASEYATPESTQPFRALDRTTGAAAGLPAGEPGGVSAGAGGDLGRALPEPVGGVPLRTRDPVLGITPGRNGSPLRDVTDDRLQMAQTALGAAAGAYQGDEYDEDDRDWERAARIAGGAIGGAIGGANAPNARRIYRAAMAARAFPPARAAALDAGPSMGIRRKSFEPGDVPEGFDPQSVLRANRTARGENFSKNAVTPRYLVETASPEEAGKVLDFGSGNDAVWTKKLREQGYDVTAHEFGVNTIEGVHDRDALSRQYDTVFASSVLNTQDAPVMMDGTLGQLAKAAKPGGRVIFNYPLQPRYWLDPDGPKDPTDGQGRASPERVLSHIQKFFGDVRQVNDDPTRPTWEARDPIVQGAPAQPGLLQRAGSAVRRFGAALSDETGELRIAAGQPDEAPRNAPKGPPTGAVPLRGQDRGPELGLGPLQNSEDLARVRANPPEGGFTGEQQNELMRASTKIAQAEAAAWIKAPETAAPGAKAEQTEAERGRRLVRRQEALQKVDAAETSQDVADAAADADDAARRGEIAQSDADAVRGKAARKLQEQKGQDGPPAPGEIDREIEKSRSRRGTTAPEDVGTKQAREEAKTGRYPGTQPPSQAELVGDRAATISPEELARRQAAAPEGTAVARGEETPRQLEIGGDLSAPRPPQAPIPGMEAPSDIVGERARPVSPEELARRTAAAPAGTAVAGGTPEARQLAMGGEAAPGSAPLPKLPGQQAPTDAELVGDRARPVSPEELARRTAPVPEGTAVAGGEPEARQLGMGGDLAPARPAPGRLPEMEPPPISPPQSREPGEANPSLPMLIGPNSHRLVDEHGNLLTKQQIASGLMGAAAQPGGWNGALREMTDGWSDAMRRFVMGSQGTKLSPAEQEAALARMGGTKGKGTRTGPSRWEEMGDKQKESYKDLRWSHVFDAVGTAMRMNLVVTPESIGRNAMSTTIGLPFRLYEAAAGPAFSRVWAALPGVHDKSPEASYSREAVAMVEGMYRSAAAAAANAASIMRRGDPERRLTDNQLDNPNVDFHQTKLAERMGTLFRPLTATDAYLKTLNEGMEAYRLSYRQAQTEFNKGLLGPDANKIRTRMIEIMNTPTKKMLNEIQQAGEYNTFNQKAGHIARIMESIKNWDGGGNPYFGGAWRLFANYAVPFVRISTNVMKYGLERTVPGGMVSMAQGAASGKSSIELGQRTARMTEGALMSAGLAGLAQSGLIEIAGALPEDDTEREEWELQGKTPYSVRIGDRWYSAAAYPGVAENVVMAGLMGDIQRKAQAKEARGEEVGLGDYGSATMDAALQYFGQTGIRPMFGGLANIIGAGTARSEGQRKYYIDQLTKQGVGQLAPASGLMRQIGNVTDRTQRAPEGAAENLAAIYPWWRENLPAKTNALGQEMQSEGSKWPLAGLFSSKEASDTVQRRKYLGSRSAAQDLEISRAIEAVNAYNKDRRANPKPTRAEVRMAAKFKGRLNPRRKAIDEKVKTREDRAAESRRRANAGGYGANPFEFQVPGLFRDLIGSEA